MDARSRQRTSRVRTLRRNATDAEIKFWLALRDRRLDGFKFSRQVPIGPYIADFVCRDCMVVIEVDGGQHAESTRDEKRDAFMRQAGYCVLRFWNSDVLRNGEGVLSTILAKLRSYSP